MKFELSVEIAAPLETVWAVLVDVDRWPEWSESVQRVQRLDQGPLALASRVRVEQPRLRPAVWQVTELTPLKSFTWVAASGPVTTVGGHRLVPLDGSRVRVDLTIEHTGWLAPLVGRLTAGLTRRYMRFEGEGLKRRCEQP